MGRGRRQTENVGMFRVHAEQERQHNSFLEEEVDEMRKTVQISAIDRDETNRTNLARHRSSEIEWEEILAETVEGRECAKFDIYIISLKDAIGLVKRYNRRTGGVSHLKFRLTPQTTSARERQKSR